jgi:hypothetical protein
VVIDQWMRVIHPNAPTSPKAPKLDARIDDPGVALIHVEAKGTPSSAPPKEAEGEKDEPAPPLLASLPALCARVGRTVHLLLKLVLLRDEAIVQFSAVG